MTSTGNITILGIQAQGILATSFSGAVTVTSTGNITTHGDQSQGIEAAGFGTGAMTVTSTGNVAVTGAGSFAIFATNAGAVTITSSGNVTASGSGVSVGITGASTGGPITINVNSGTVTGGSGISAAVLFAGGTNNTLTNKGTLTALSGYAIVGENNGFTPNGNNTVNNFGTVTGSVVLEAATAVGNVLLGGGGGANTFNNMAGGVFNSGASVSLGPGNALTNAGTLSPGGAGSILTTAVSGNMVQTATGALVTDINIGGGTADRINVSGTANLAGAVQLQVANLSLAPFQQTILSATGGTTNNGLTLLASPALQAQLVFPNATDVVVKSSGINFVVAGSNANQAAVGNGLNHAAQTSGLGGPIFSLLLNTTSLPAFGAELTVLSGEAATGTQQVTFNSMSTFMGLMLDLYNRGTISTPAGGASHYADDGDASAYAADGRKRTKAERDAYAMFTKAPPQAFEARWSVWAAGFGGSQTTDGNTATGSNSVTSRLAGGAVGADYLISPYTVAGFALAGGGTSFNLANNLGSGRSDLFQAGVHARHIMVRCLHQRRAGLWLAGRHDRSHPDAGRPRPVAGEVQRQRVFGAARRRLPLRCADHGRRRHHALRRGSVHDV